VRRTVKALLAANQPVLCAGQGVLYAEATNELVELAETLDAPVMTTLLGKSCFPENHPLSLGAGASSSPDGVYHFLAKADLICGVGCSFLKTAFAARIPEDKLLVHITNDRGDIDKDYRCRYSLIGDAKLVLRQLLDGIRVQSVANNLPPVQNPAEEIAAVRNTWLGNWLPKLTSDEVPINPYRVIWDVKNIFEPTETIVTHDSGSSREQVVPFWPAIEPRSFIGWGNSTQLGSSLGFAMGAKLATPSKHVINFMGDAAWGMVGMDIETAVRARIPIITILLNNSTMGIYSDSDFPIAGKRYGVKKLSGNYTRVAQALGAHAERVVVPSEIIPALERAIEATEKGLPALLEVITKEERDFTNCKVFDPL
jgi:thiamine pyrophosphate-dependent acetolactate synthase large subunit-like protein